MCIRDSHTRVCTGGCVMRLVGPLSPLLAGPARPDPATADVYGKLMDDVDAAVDVVRDGAAGFPFALRDALARKRRMNLTVIANNGDFGQLAYDGGLRRLICSYPTDPSGQLVAG